MSNGKGHDKGSDMDRSIHIRRETKETTIDLSLDLDKPGPQSFDIGLPFMAHMLNALAFHGGFSLTIKAVGDLEVDPHHLVEDLGLVLGQALWDSLEKGGPVARYGHSIIPMDDALAEAVVDVCKRPCLVYKAVFPQTHAGSFDLSLMKEFFAALSNRAQINLHLLGRYGDNSHHLIEALFKALGRALKAAYQPLSPEAGVRSTKGLI